MTPLFGSEAAPAPPPTRRLTRRHLLAVLGKAGVVAIAAATEAGCAREGLPGRSGPLAPSAFATASFEDVPGEHPAYSIVLHLAETYGLVLPAPADASLSGLMPRYEFGRGLVPVLGELAAVRGIAELEQALGRLRALPVPDLSLAARAATALQRPATLAPAGAWAETLSDPDGYRAAFGWLEALASEFAAEVELFLREEAPRHGLFPDLQALHPPFRASAAPADSNPVGFSQKSDAFADVPLDHPAYPTVQLLAEQGRFTGFPDGTFDGRRALTRYEFAIALQRMRADFSRKKAVVDAAPVDWGAAIRWLLPLTYEFADELAMLGADVGPFISDLRGEPRAQQESTP
jgi:hypothetical protein